MAVPKKKHSKARTRRRRQINSTLAVPKLVRSPDSGVWVRSHCVDTVSGFYRGKQVMKKLFTGKEEK